MKTIVICGKGGIGKSTVSTNLALSLHRRGLSVLQVGCDPKHDSCAGHLDAPIATVMDEFSERGRMDGDELRDLVVAGRTGVHCIEIGGPQPGVGCAGRAISLVLDFLNESPDLFNHYDLRLFDVVGDVVCGGFAAPIRTGPDTAVCLVVSGEFLALYAANNIARGVVNLSRRGGGRVAGVIGNLRDTPAEREMIASFAENLGTRVLGWIPRDRHISLAELDNRTVLEAFPDAPAAHALIELADAIAGLGADDLVVPTPMADDALKASCREYLE